MKKAARLMVFALFFLSVCLVFIACNGGGGSKGKGDGGKDGGTNKQQFLIYELINDGTEYQVSGTVNGISGDVIVPHIYNGKPVTVIKEEAFANCSGLANVTIPDSITSVGNNAFLYCTNLSITWSYNPELTAGNFSKYLKTVIIPDSITSIGFSAFSDCTKLTGITIPDSVTSIGNYAFEDCSGLNSIVIPNSVTSIGLSAFEGCGALTSITIPDSIKNIGRSAFSGCESLTSITVPLNITDVGDYAFYNCSGLTEINFNAVKMTDLPGTNYVFHNAGAAGSGVTVNIGADVTRIPNYLLYPNGGSLPKIIAVNFAEDGMCDSIGFYAFSGCINLMDITIPDSVISVKEFAFLNCDKLSITWNYNPALMASNFSKHLKNVNFSDSITNITFGAFYGCTGLESITIPFTGNTLNGIQNTHFGYIFGAPQPSDQNSYIPASLKTVILTGDNIVYNAFLGCTGLTNIIMSDSVKSINDSAFLGCTGLTSITIPDSVTTIGKNVFLGCTGLTSITIPNNIKNIGSSAFYNCTNLVEINLNAVNMADLSADDCVFRNAGSTNTGITINIGSDVIKIPSYLFYSYRISDDTLKILALNFAANSVCKNIGDCAFSYSNSLVRMTIPNSVTRIGKRAFLGCTGLTNITIPESVTDFGDDSFLGCTGLTNITIVNGVTDIGSNAFSGCTGLTSITIPDSVTSIGYWAFSKCIGLTDITISNSIRTLETGIFTDCTSLTSITIPNSVTNIRGAAFANCISLTSITIPNSVTNIEGSAFRGCSGLENIVVLSDNKVYKNDRNCLITLADNTLVLGCKNSVIPDYVATIGSNAFYGCIGLTNINFPSSITSIGESAFDDCSGLMSIIIPNNVKNIGSRAFRDCTGLTRIIIEYGATSIGENAFSGCRSLTYIAMPNSITSIGEQAFFDCDSLTNITIPNGVTVIREGTFMSCDGLISITIPNKVTNIEDFAFNGCNSLRNINIMRPSSESIIILGMMAFAGSSIENIYVPDSTSVAAYKAASRWSDYSSLIKVKQ